MYPFARQYYRSCKSGKFFLSPWLNIYVSRIYTVPSENPHLYAARICTNKNVIDVSLLGRYCKSVLPGGPGLNSSSDDKIDIEMEMMEIQEVKVGEVIKGDKVGYRVLKIVPPDLYPCREIKDAANGVKGRIIGWVEIDPTPIPLDEKGNSIEKE